MVGIHLGHIQEIVLKFFWPLPISNTILKNIVYRKKNKTEKTLFSPKPHVEE